ncbi:SET domain-containing protein [Trametes punicea]|nr:SET domain-containing protein [Trametes punicea]
MDDLDAKRWERLLEWLSSKHGMDTNAMFVEARQVPGAGRGLFASRDIPPSSILFQVPSSALINVKTLLPLYPQVKEGRLSGVQLVSFHLLLHKPSGKGDSLDSCFGPYVSTLPRDFSSHPLTWSINRKLGKEDPWSNYFLDHVPPSTRKMVRMLSERFWADWEAIVAVMRDDPTILSQSSRSELTAMSIIAVKESFSDYLWAWLNVNTRCIYYRLRQSRSDPDNFTMCPILDFANHGPARTHIFPVIESDIWDVTTPRAPGSKLSDTDTFVFFGPSDYLVPKGQELLLHYGSHSNCFLFAEYGFVNSFPDGAIASGIFVGEVDLQDFIEEMIERAGPNGSLIKSTLQAAGYWGEWTIHGAPTPAHPSWRLISALRLLCALDRSSSSIAETETAITAWKEVTNGIRAMISPSNEDSWRQALLVICSSIRDRARQSLAGLLLRPPEGGPPWVDWMAENVRTLWREELEVAEAVISSLHAGSEF